MLKVIQISRDSASIVHEIQKISFKPLLEKYQDYDMSPALETLDRIIEKIDRTNTKSYIFQLDEINVGWVRIIELEEMTYKVAALCILPEYQNRGIAQKVLKEIESYYPNARKWILDTILEEKGNCYLYEKLGYVKVGEVISINERMTLVNYVKEVDRI